MKRLGVPGYIKKRISDPSYEKTWLVQLLSHMDTDSSTSALPTISEKESSVKKLAESYEDKRKSSFNFVSIIYLVF